MLPAIKHTLGLFVNCLQFAWLPIACTISRYTDDLTLETQPAQLTHTQTYTIASYHHRPYLIDSCLCSRDTEYPLCLDSFCVQIVNGLSHNVRYLGVSRTEGHAALSLRGWGQVVHQHLEKGRCRVWLNVQVVRCIRAGTSRGDRGCSVDSEVPRLRGWDGSATTRMVLHLILREKLLQWLTKDYTRLLRF